MLMSIGHSSRVFWNCSLSQDSVVNSIVKFQRDGLGERVVSIV